MNFFLNNLFTICDAPRAWGVYFQDSANPQMEALVVLAIICLAGVVYAALIAGIGLGSCSQTLFFIFKSILPTHTTVYFNALHSVISRFLNSLYIVKLYLSYLLSLEIFKLSFIILARIIPMIVYFFFFGETCYAMDGLEDQIIKVKEDIAYWTSDYNVLVAVYNESGFANVPDTLLSPEQLAERNRLLENLADGRRNVLSSKSELLKLQNVNIPSQLSVKRGFTDSNEDTPNKKR